MKRLLILLLPLNLIAAPSPIGPRVSQTLAVRSDLLTFKPSANMAVRVMGYYAPGDCPPMDFVYDPSDESTATNEVNVFKPAGMPGRLTFYWDGNVKQAGARGDGVTDDTDAIQRAIDTALLRASNNYEGRIRIRFPAGRYIFSGLRFFSDDDPDNVLASRYWTIEGEGDGQTILYSNSTNANAFHIKGGGAVIRDLWLDSTDARRAVMGATGTNGVGILVAPLGTGSSAPFTLENCHVQYQPGDGIRLIHMELVHLRQVFSQTNGGVGINIASRESANPFESAFVGTVVNTRATYNAQEGVRIQGSYLSFDGLEAFDNRGRGQVVATNLSATRNLQFRNLDLEGQPYASAAITIRTNGVVIAGSTITANYNFETAGYGGKRWLALHNTDFNDGIWTIVSVSGSTITVAETLVNETVDGDPNCDITATDVGWGLILNGRGHRVIGGHFSGLGGGILLEQAEGCQIDVLSVGNFNHAWKMGSQVKLSNTSTNNRVELPQFSGFYTDLGGVDDYGGRNEVTGANLGDYRHYGWPWRWVNSGLYTNAWTLDSAKIRMLATPGLFVIGDSAESGVTRTFRVGFQPGTSTNRPMGFATGSSFTSGGGTITLGGGSTLLNPPTTFYIAASAADTPGASTENRVAISQGGVNIEPGGITSIADTTAALEVRSTTKGFLPPRLTTANRDAIASPAVGLTIFNITDYALESWDGTNWVSGNLTLENVQDNLGNEMLLPTNGITGSYNDGLGHYEFGLSSRPPFTMQFGPVGNTATIADSTTYYFGNSGSLGVTAFAAQAEVPVLVDSTIIGYWIRTRLLTAGSNEEVGIALLVGGATVVGSTNQVWDTTALQSLSVTGLSQTVTAGQTIVPRFTTPAWGTNPTNLSAVCVVWLRHNEP